MWFQKDFEQMSFQNFRVEREKNLRETLFDRDRERERLPLLTHATADLPS